LASAAAGLGHALVEHGRRVLFVRTRELVQQLQVANRELRLAVAIAKLDKYHLLVLDDIAYVAKDQAETRVRRTSTSPRCRRSSGSLAAAHSRTAAPIVRMDTLEQRSGCHPDEERLNEITEATASPAAREAGPAMFEQMATYHPKEPPWHLPLIGVDPAQHGRGHGDALMRYALERCDRDNRPAYLESTNPRNISLYRRHGFEPVGAIQAGSSPTLVPMLRQPRGKG